MKSDPERHHPVPERPDRPFRATESLGTSVSQLPSDFSTDDIRHEPAPEPQPTREPIATVPKDGRDVRVFWGDDDEIGRVARWKDGRWFNGRRWLPGGRWTPSDGLTPLTMDPPSHWECPVDYEEPQTDETVAA